MHERLRLHASMERPPLPGFICPITQDVMETPMVGPDGRSYERSAIEEALRHNPISPVTRQPMTAGSLVMNFALRDIIESWRLEQPMAIDPARLDLTVPEEVIGRGSFGKVSTGSYQSCFGRYPLNSARRLKMGWWPFVCVGCERNTAAFSSRSRCPL